MMDTILNVGLDSSTEEFWRGKVGDACVADSLHRLVTMYGSVVKGIDREALEKDDVISAFKTYQRKTGEEFPDTKGQILGSIEAVFKSWDNSRAKFYRKMNNIPEEWGTAVVIQAMVFGNLNDNSGTGVLFTRNPDSGANEITGEFLVNAQGEDVVAGIRTPMPLKQMPSWNAEVAQELMDAVNKLEKAKKDVQDVEFTIQDGKLFILQTRNAKRSAGAAVKIAMDMLEEGLIDAKTALSRVTPRQFDLAQIPVIDPSFKGVPVATGIPACSGVVTGKPVFTAQDAIDCKEPCILVSKETTPDDIEGMDAAVGVLTMTGGATSHAAVVARGMNKPCVVGLLSDNVITVDYFHDKKLVSIDGATGRVWVEKVPVVDGSASKHIAAYKALALMVLNVIPAVTEVKSAMHDVLLDVSGDLSDLKGAVAKVVYAAANVTGTLYVDCDTTNLSPAQDAMLRMFAAPQAEELFLMQLEVELAKVAAKNVIVVTTKSTTLPVLGTASDLRSMILCEGKMAIRKGATTVPADDKATKKVLGWLKAEGLDFVNLGFKGESGVSIMSPEAAMQSI
jgi:phosphoenolpyruvate synthase/pyruvate phosphate dikinase